MSAAAGARDAVGNRMLVRILVRTTWLHPVGHVPPEAVGLRGEATEQEEGRGDGHPQPRQDEQKDRGGDL